VCHAKASNHAPRKAVIERHGRCSTSRRVPAPAPPDLLNSYRDALGILGETLVSLHILVKAQRAGERLPNEVLDRLEHQCTAAAVSASMLRQTLARFTTSE
jgi:hypothetical protein